MPPEERAALDWLRSAADFDVRPVQLVDLAAARIAPTTLIWWHYAAAPELPSAAMRPDTIGALRGHVDNGGHLLLSLFAVSYVVPLGLETVGPDQIEFVPGSDFVPAGQSTSRVLAGMQSRRGHPLLRRFWGATYSAAIGMDERYPVARYRGDRWPAQGAVVALARRVGNIRSADKVAIEYAPSHARPGGRVLTLGEAIYFSDPLNRNRTQLEMLVTDALVYLAGQLPPAPLGAGIASAGATALPPGRTMAGQESSAPAPPGSESDPDASQPTWDELPDVLAATSYWGGRGGTIQATQTLSTAAPELPDPATLLGAVSAARSGLTLETTIGPATAFDLYSPRVLLNGRQSGRVEHLWTYPVRIMGDLRFGVLRPDMPVQWLDEMSTGGQFVARPEGHTVRAITDDLSIALHLAVSRDRGGLLALIEVAADAPVQVIASWQVDHAPMGSSRRDDLDDLLLGWDSGARAVFWRDPAGRVSAYGGFGRPAARVMLSFDPARDLPELGTLPIEPSGGDNEPAGLTSRRVAVVVPYDPTSEAVLSFAIGGGLDEDSPGRETYLELLRDPVAVWTANANYYRQFIQDTLDIVSSDPTFNEAFRWAKVGLDAFRVTTPTMGTGTVAGYGASTPVAAAARTEPGAAEQTPTVSYVARDAIWASLAADAYGGTDLSSETLRFLARYQDVDGKILHQMSPDWSINYDDADTTPLFLLGLEHHVRSTGDRQLLRTLWPSVRRAMSFLDTTDGDGDGLIDSTGLGHGWIDEGTSTGTQTTLYLAGLWGATLDAVAHMATWMADEELAASSRQRVESTRELLNNEFWDDARRSYFHGKRADGTFVPSRTVMPAIPMYFGLLDEPKVGPFLDLLAGAEMTTDWGVRGVELGNPAADPAGIESGTVWPLYSGWSSLAAYLYHRPLAGYFQLNANLRLYRSGNLGHIPGSLNGKRFEPDAISSHQAWSQAMAILPAVEGLLGIRPDALQGRLRIHPHLPGGWNEVVAQPIRVGEDAFKITVLREPETTRFVVERLAGANPIELELSLPFPRSVLVNLDRDATTGAALAEGETIIDHPSEKEALVRATLTESTATVTFRHSRYPQVIQTWAPLERGDTSTGLRIIDTQFSAATMALRTEGMAGRTYRVNLITPWPVAAVTGLPRTRVLSAGPGRATLELSFPGTSGNYQRADINVEFRR